MKKIMYFIMALFLISFVSAVPDNLQNPELYVTFNNVTANTYSDFSYNNDDLYEIGTQRNFEGCKIGGCMEAPGTIPNRLYPVTSQYLFENDAVGTISFWINTSTNTVYKSILANRYLNDYGEYCSIILGVDQGKIMMDVSSTAAECGGSSNNRDFWRGPAINDGVWHHVVWASDGTDYWVYVDGVRSSLTAVPIGTTQQGRWFDEVDYKSTPTQFMGWNTEDVNLYNLDGSLDEFAYYGYNLTGPSVSCAIDNSSEVCQLWNGGAGYVPINLSLTVTANASIQPTIATNATALTGFCNVSLSAGFENVTLDTSWKKNGMTTYTYYNITTLIAPENVNASTIPAANLTAGDTWQFLCRATTTDGSATSGWSESSLISIASTQKTAFMLRALNSLTGNPLYPVTFNVTNATGWVNSSTSSDSNYVRIVVPTAGNFNLSATLESYGTVNISSSITLGSVVYYTFSMGGNIRANIYDEAQSGINGSNYPFDITIPENLNFILYCADDTQTRIQNVSTNPYDFTLDCPFKKFEMFLRYNNGYTYYRRYIEDSDILNSTGAFAVYLADYSNTTIYDSLMRVTFRLVDFSNAYENPRVVVKKVINSETVVITADYAEQSVVNAYLLRNNEYIIEIQSDNYPTLFYGYYTPVDFYETKFLSLYEISLAAEPTGISGVEYTTWSSNSTGTLTGYLYYNDTDVSTTSYNWSLHINSSDGPLLYSIVVSNNNIILTKDMSAWENRTIISKLTVNRPIQVPDYIKMIYIPPSENIVFPLKDYFGSKIMDWVITILLGLILLYGTKANAGLTIIFVGAVAAITRLFGWYSLGIVYSTLIILLGILLMFKGDKNSA